MQTKTFLDSSPPSFCLTPHHSESVTPPFSWCCLTLTDLIINIKEQYFRPFLTFITSDPPPCQLFLNPLHYTLHILCHTNNSIHLDPRKQESRSNKPLVEHCLSLYTHIDLWQQWILPSTDYGSCKDKQRHILVELGTEGPEGIRVYQATHWYWWSIPPA